MDIKDILLPVRPGVSGLDAAAVAGHIGQEQGAMVTGICVTPLPPLTTADCYALGANAVSEVVHRFDSATETLVGVADVPFEAAMRSAGCAFAWRHTDPGASYETVAVDARMTDLVVMPRPGKEDVGGRELVQTMVMLGGAPCLLVPENQCRSHTFERVVLAWNGSRQAKRAMDGAMPFLRRAKTVDILVFGPTRRDSECDQLAAHLRRKGVIVEVTRLPIHNPDCAQAVLAWCSAAGSDLLVMGAFGHSPQREHWFGGTTFTIMTTAPLPVLMAN